jgi:hypothetical protein
MSRVVSLADGKGAKAVECSLFVRPAPEFAESRLFHSRLTRAPPLQPHVPEP